MWLPTDLEKHQWLELARAVIIIIVFALSVLQGSYVTKHKGNGGGIKRRKVQKDNMDRKSETCRPKT